MAAEAEAAREARAKVGKDLSSCVSQISSFLDKDLQELYLGSFFFNFAISTSNLSLKKYEKLSMIDKEFSLGKEFILNGAKNLVTITINIEFYSSFYSIEK